METRNAEINIDHRTRPVVLFSHQTYDLFESYCARVPTRSFGGHREDVTLTPYCFTSTEARLLIGGGGGGGGVKARPRPWTAARTMEVLRRMLMMMK